MSLTEESAVEFLVIYLSMLAIYVIIDFIWITLFMQPYFTANLGHLLRESVGISFLITYGSIFFVFYVLGVYWFGVRAGISSNSAIVATLSGGFLGFLAYGTYGLTNYIFFKGYPLSITLLDITWGTFLGGAVSFCGYLIFVRFFYQS